MQQRPLDEHEFRLPCRDCNAMILPVTAERNLGLCGSCVRSRRERPEHLRRAGKSILLTPLLPFGALLFGIYSLLATAWFHFRFPYDKAALETAILAAYPDRDTARRYLAAVMEGYGRNRPYKITLTSDRVRLSGYNDGGRLRRQELTIHEIPADWKQSRKRDA